MSRRGMTLIEMMVAMTATLLLMGAIAQVFSVFGTAVSDSRSIIETDARMRAVAWKLRNDLAGATAPTLPPLRPDTDAGYFEVIEGPGTDIVLWDQAGELLGSGEDQTADLESTDTSDDRILGDVDDVLLFTTRQTDPPFLGRFGAGKYESTIAEVAWFLRPTQVAGATAPSNPVTYTLYRRQLLVVGYAGAGDFATSNNMIDSSHLMSATGTTDWQRFMGGYDISARAARLTTGGTNFMPNTLADLTRRESRFMHNISGDTIGTNPKKTPRFLNKTAPEGLTFDGTTRAGEDTVLSNVIAFDVRVFDPTAPVQLDGETVVLPGDPGFVDSAPSIGMGGYVDLGYGNVEELPSDSSNKGRFASGGYGESRIAGTSPSSERIWDTYSSHYESDGVDTDNNHVIDQGSNGFDDDGDGVVDNGPVDLNGDRVLDVDGSGRLKAEMETSPPYPFPLRGIEVRIRCYEPTSRQVRQMTIRHTFVR